VEEVDMSAAAALRPGVGAAFDRLTPEQCQRVAQASFAILERTGVELHEPAAVDLLRKAGARIDGGNRVRIPTRLVEQALASAPRQVVLHDRDGQAALRLEGRHSYFGPGSDCLHIIDHRTGQRRKPVLQDVSEGVRLCDALPHIDFVMSMFLPSDVPAETADRYQMEAMLNNTAKPIVIVSYDTPGMWDAVAMAEAVAGGSAALQARPFVAAYVNVTTALRHNAEALQKLLFLAEKALPCCYIPGATAGAVAPVTVAGSVALRYAGALAGLVIAQLKREGAPILLPGWGALPLDMRTLVQPYAGPDFQGAALAVAHYFGLPAFSAGGVTDAKVVDQQAAMEAALTLMVNRTAGGHLVHDVGYMESGLSGSLAQLVICDAALEWIKRATGEVEVSPETLAVDLVEQLGPDGSFLETDHTLRHFREQWQPELIDRDNLDGWLEKGGQSLAERAAARASEILAGHQTPTLPAEAARAIHAIVERSGS
jgi:trimethylamine--corrinoid protein Co-methyltransferase